MLVHPFILLLHSYKCLSPCPPQPEKRPALQWAKALPRAGRSQGHHGLCHPRFPRGWQRHVPASLLVPSRHTGYRRLPCHSTRGTKPRKPRGRLCAGQRGARMGRAALQRPVEMYSCHTRREMKGIYKLYDFSCHAGNRSEAAGSDSRSLQNAKLAVPPATTPALGPPPCPSAPARSSAPLWPPGRARGCTQPRGEHPRCREARHPPRLSCNLTLTARAPRCPHCPHCPCHRSHPAPQPGDGRRRLQCGVK